MDLILFSDTFDGISLPEGVAGASARRGADHYESMDFTGDQEEHAAADSGTTVANLNKWLGNKKRHRRQM